MDKPKQMCLTHGRPLKYSRKEKTWYCPDCLYSSFLSWQAQQEAVKRYRESNKGKEAQKRYEDSESGQTARQRYLKSEKYKQRRREYNQRLKESLQIARAAHLERPTSQKEVERQVVSEMSPIVMDILEYQDTMGKSPTPTEVREWANEVYKTAISLDKAKELIESTIQRRHRK